MFQIQSWKWQEYVGHVHKGTDLKRGIYTGVSHGE